MGSIVRKQDTGDQLGRLTREPLWDSEALVGGVTYQQVNFFVRPKGVADNLAVIKGTRHTNLETANALGEPSQFLMMGIQLKTTNFADAAMAATAADAAVEFERRLRATGALEFGLNGKVLLQLPLSEIPSGLDAESSHFSAQVAAVNPLSWAVTNGMPMPNSYYTIRVPNDIRKMYRQPGVNTGGYILINSNTSIICRVLFNPALVMTYAQANLLVTLQVRLIGIRLKSLG
jgi:hypothetical protein